MGGDRAVSFRQIGSMFSVCRPDARRTMNRTMQIFTRWLGPAAMFAMGSWGSSPPALAQLPPAQLAPGPTSAIAACQPPQPAEFLLLVVTRTPDSQLQVNQLLPPNTSIGICQYLNDTVTRVGGFRTLDRANAWARYITETTGLAAFVARPAESPGSSAAAQPPTSSPPTATKPAGQTSVPATGAGFNPKPLGPGYAVLVNYANQPETAAKVQQVLGKEVGLAAYGQSPFLLALYTTDSNAAYAALQTLSDRGFWATLVDSRRVILLRQPVAVPRAVSKQS